ncbi:MAG TPA: class I SAM-dependent methyltransferase [Gemmatimonadaceae bacterium]|nr:class I SAM-dependent methyltransferase [Gemmatimonadaceae bacterium]
MSQRLSEFADPASGNGTRQLPNRTRRSESIPRRLVAEGKYHLLPVYALLTTSDLAREGIRNSGSFRFADHIYRNEPSGRYGVGRLLDRVLLKLRGARSMRSRFFHSRREILRVVREMAGVTTGQLTVLSVPCGIARDLYEVAETLHTTEPALYEHVRFIGIDLDGEALDLSRELTQDHPTFDFQCADALAAGSLPGRLDAIVSLGFGEFLSDGMLYDFYRRCHSSLNPSGRFITSAMSRDRISDYLARELAELYTHYRSADQLVELLKSAGFAKVQTTHDEVGLQTLAVAEKVP